LAARRRLRHRSLGDFFGNTLFQYRQKIFLKSLRELSKVTTADNPCGPFLHAIKNEEAFQFSTTFPSILLGLLSDNNLIHLNRPFQLVKPFRSSMARRIL